MAKKEQDPVDRAAALRETLVSLLLLDDSDGSKNEKKDDKDAKGDESPKEHALAA